jgi:hypothetical protein
MTAWWISTTKVRNVRVRSRAKLRAFAAGTARISGDGDASELVIDVIAGPGS